LQFGNALPSGQLLSHDTQGLGARFPELLEFLPGREIVGLFQILVDGGLQIFGLPQLLFPVIIEHQVSGEHPDMASAVITLTCKGDT